MYSFSYHRASDIDDAHRALLGSSDPKLLAGGQTLLASLKLRLAQPDRLIDLGTIPGISNIQLVSGGHVSVGAMARHAHVATSDAVCSVLPALSSLAGGIGDPLVRNLGTIGGSLANNDPAADYPAAALGLGATIVTNTRRIAADDFFIGMFQTALKEHEIITHIEFPIPERAAYVKFKHPASRFALVGVFVAKTASGVRVAVTGAGAGVFRAHEIEELLTKQFVPEALDNIQMDESLMNSDLQASASYRANLVKVIAQRAVTAALS